jgi:hypothetical protein
MMTARAMALILFSMSSRPQSLPTSIQDVQTRAWLVRDIDNAIGLHFASYNQVSDFQGQISALPQGLFDFMLKDMTKTTDKQIPGIDNIHARNGVGFLLWSGCISAAKAIALDTRDGVNTPESRMRDFTNLINPLCGIDEFYKAGVETAPIFKRLLNQAVSFDGVPDGSPVLKYKDTPLRK